MTDEASHREAGDKGIASSVVPQGYSGKLHTTDQLIGRRFNAGAAAALRAYSSIGAIDAGERACRAASTGNRSAIRLRCAAVRFFERQTD